MNSEPKEAEVVRIEVTDEKESIEIFTEVVNDASAEGIDLGVTDTQSFADKSVEAKELIISDEDDEPAGSV